MTRQFDEDTIRRIFGVTREEYEADEDGYLAAHREAKAQNERAAVLVSAALTLGWNDRDLLEHGPLDFLP